MPRLVTGGQGIVIGEGESTMTDCEHSLNLVKNRDGSYVTGLLAALAHLARAWCRADLSNQPWVAESTLAVMNALAVMDREARGRELILVFLGSRAQGGRGDELLEALDKRKKMGAR